MKGDTGRGKEQTLRVCCYERSLGRVLTLISTSGKRYCYYGVDDYNYRRISTALRYGQVAKALRIAGPFARRDLHVERHEGATTRCPVANIAGSDSLGVR